MQENAPGAHVGAPGVDVKELAKASKSIGRTTFAYNLTWQSFMASHLVHNVIDNRTHAGKPDARNKHVA